jgi:hypothetical protein
MSNFSIYKSEEELDALKEVVESTTDNNYIIKPDGVYGFYTIVREGKGKIPDALNGKYTSMKQARQAIKLHESDPRVAQNRAMEYNSRRRSQEREEYEAKEAARLAKKAEKETKEEVE